MAPVLRSEARAKRPRTSSEPLPPVPSTLVDDANATDVALVGADDPVSVVAQTPPPTPRRSLRLSEASASSDPLAPCTIPNPSLRSDGDGAGAAGKRKGGPSMEEEVVAVVEERRSLTLRSSARLRAILGGSSPNVEEADPNRNTSRAASVNPGRTWGRPRRVNPADQELQFRQGEQQMMGGGDDGDGDEEETKQGERHLSLRLASGGDRDKGEDKLIIDQEIGVRSDGVGSGGSLDKGKAKLVVDDSEFNLTSDSIADLEEGVELRYSPDPPEAPDAAHVQSRREARRNRVIELAPKFAFFKDDAVAESDSGTDEESLTDAGAYDWPGPFSTAMRIIEEREAIVRAREEAYSSRASQSAAIPISWTPSRDKRPDAGSSTKSPNLQSIVNRVFINNADEIETLETLPDLYKNKVVTMLCKARKMTAHLLSGLVRGSPVELQLSDCSWATDREFEDIFTCCDTSKLKASVS